jgi:general secretion pathway protein L
MNTCYIFASHFDEDNCLCILLDKNLVIEPLKLRSIDDVKLLQSNAKTIIVLATELCGIYELEIPFLNKGKARNAIAFALEDNLAAPVSNLHFVFDKEHYIDNKYLVAVIEKSIIANIVRKLNETKIKYNIITCDWFALDLDEACIIENNILINSHDFKGALSIELIDKYLLDKLNFDHIKVFNDTQSISQFEKFSKLDISSYTWLATRLAEHNPMNFCQGEFKQSTRQDGLKLWYKIALFLGGAWLFSLFLKNLVLLLFLNMQLASFDNKIANVYKEFFPDAKQVISPKFRVEQLLNSNYSSLSENLWKLLGALGQSLHFDKTSSVIIKQMSFQNQTLAITIACNNFQTLTKIESNLERQKISVRKVGALNQGAEVIAKLELK